MTPEFQISRWARVFAATPFVTGLLLVLATVGGYAQVTQNIGTLSPNKSVTLSFEVTIDLSLPITVTRISAQGIVSADSMSSVVTDDPETLLVSDPTLTTLSQDFNFGFAPDPPYPSLLANDGARHFIPGSGATLYLGSTPPQVTDGIHLITDQDGIVLPAVLAASENVTATLTGSAPGYLNAWIDYDRNGSWSDPGEQVFIDCLLAAGANSLNLTIPASIGNGKTYARFRLSSQLGLLVTGTAPDGEVADYEVTLNSPPVAANFTIERYPSQSVKISVANVLSHASDPDGESMSLTSVDSALPTGASVARSGDWVMYTPAPGDTSAGSFAYTVSDPHGASGIGTVTIAIVGDNGPSRNWDIQPLGGSSFRVTFHGIPGRAYRMQYTDSLNPPNTAWTTISTQTADAAGVYSLIDSAGSLTRFYRSVSP